MLSLLWDCLPLFAIISPMVLDFFLSKFKVHKTRTQQSAWVKFQMVISVSVAVVTAGFDLGFAAAIFYLFGLLKGLAVLMLIFTPIIGIFVFYKRITQTRNQKKARGKVHKTILVSSAIVSSGFLVLPVFFSFDLSVICLAIGAPGAIFAFYKMATQRLRNRGSEEVTARWFLSICLVVIGFIVVFPATNFWASLVAQAMQLRAMDRFIGVSTETFIAVLGQPDGRSETRLDYSHVPCYSYGLPDDDIAVIIQDDKIKACISH